ncbi:MAG: tetratricopeptide repeat protein [Chloroflexi bacterium]|nr:tetratricopeptide repeat protein [Chloroflexota bacterium]
MLQQVFVGRQAECDQLAGYLERAVAGRGQIAGQVAFVTGEAGAGKTALVTEFARRQQERHQNLIVAIGDCNAQTGLGDPYLPFRELLGLLTGDVEAKLAEGAITKENATRLQDFLRVSGQALLDLGPDLIEMFVPAGALAIRAGTYAAGKIGWLDRLEKVRERQEPKGDTASSTLDMEQGRIFEQYTNVIRAMAAKQPLLLVLDDLQWADTASIGLMFHLCRRISDSPIMLLGTYRPDEVALGRNGERHPLDSVVNELKRYYGDIVIELETSQIVQERRELDLFVGDYIDQAYKPNCLGPEFRQLILDRTDGHPLFLVELLRDIVERGWLAKDEDGTWYLAADLTFEDLPARVEAVIEERISRLEEDLRQILNVASVEGQNFTAQVISGVQQISERQLVPHLSRELDKQHRLIGERGIKRLGNRPLFLYRFRHNLFQLHLYNGLTVAERVMLHDAVGSYLEELYAGREQEIAVQLARHFLESFQYPKAFRYLVLAGRAAQAVYANQEAIAYYLRALTLDDEAHVPPAELAAVWENLGDVYSLLGEYQRAVQNYEKALNYAEDRLRCARIQRKLGRTYEKWGNYEAAIKSFEAGLMSMKEKLDADEAARIYAGMGLVYFRKGELPEALDLSSLALNLVEGLDDKLGIAQACNNLGIIYNTRGDWSQALESHRRCRSIYEETENYYGLAAVNNNLGLVYLNLQHWDEAVAHFRRSLELCEKIGNRHGLSRTYDNLGQVYMIQGRQDEAMECLAKAVTILAEIGASESKIYREMWQSGAW